MDMFYICHFLCFSLQIRFLAFSDLRIVTLPRGAGRHNMWWQIQLQLLPDVVFLGADRQGARQAENGDVGAPPLCYPTGNAHLGKNRIMTVGCVVIAVRGCYLGNYLSGCFHVM
ncbi:hypothetical protein ACTVLL_24775 [Serratia nevei]|uniref:hypothetical protein n=1 Tax=Serratia nevei TaxID=2703794 RepID=UPI003FA76E5D